MEKISRENLILCEGGSLFNSFTRVLKNIIGIIVLNTLYRKVVK